MDILKFNRDLDDIKSMSSEHGFKGPLEFIRISDDLKIGAVAVIEKETRPVTVIGVDEAHVFILTETTKTKVYLIQEIVSVLGYNYRTAEMLKEATRM